MNSSPRPQIEQLRNGRIDLSVSRTPMINDAKLSSILLWDDPMLVALPRNHALSRRRRLRLQDLRDEQFVMLRLDSVYLRPAHGRLLCAGRLCAANCANGIRGAGSRQSGGGRYRRRFDSAIGETSLCRFDRGCPFGPRCTKVRGVCGPATRGKFRRGWRIRTHDDACRDGGRMALELRLEVSINARSPRRYGAFRLRREQHAVGGAVVRPGSVRASRNWPTYLSDV